MKQLIRTTVAIIFSLCITMQAGYAYLDPGTGSILIQSLIAALAAGAYAIKMYWVRIKTFFSKSTDEEEGQVDGKPRSDPDQSAN